MILDVWLNFHFHTGLQKQLKQFYSWQAYSHIILWAWRVWALTVLIFTVTATWGMIPLFIFLMTRGSVQNTFVLTACVVLNKHVVYTVTRWVKCSNPNRVNGLSGAPLDRGLQRANRALAAVKSNKIWKVTMMRRVYSDNTR